MAPLQYRRRSFFGEKTPVRIADVVCFGDSIRPTCSLPVMKLVQTSRTWMHRFGDVLSSDNILRFSFLFAIVCREFSDYHLTNNCAYGTPQQQQ